MSKGPTVRSGALRRRPSRSASQPVFPSAGRHPERVADLLSDLAEHDSRHIHPHAPGSHAGHSPELHARDRVDQTCGHRGSGGRPRRCAERRTDGRPGHHRPEAAASRRESRCSGSAALRRRRTPCPPSRRRPRSWCWHRVLISGRDRRVSACADVLGLKAVCGTPADAAPCPEPALTKMPTPADSAISTTEAPPSTVTW